jgi:hypothetical protein
MFTIETHRSCSSLDTRRTSLLLILLFFPFERLPMPFSARTIAALFPERILGLGQTHMSEKARGSNCGLTELRGNWPEPLRLALHVSTRKKASLPEAGTSVPVSIIKTQCTSHLGALFLASLRTRRAPANTIQSYSHNLMHVVQAVPADLASVSASAIQTALDGDGHHSPATRERHYSTLCALNRWLLRQELTQIVLPLMSECLFQLL